MRKAVSLGGDSDTMASITGAVAEAYYRGVPPAIATVVRGFLPGEFLEVIDEFERRFPLCR